ncbi:putative AlkP superfamily pyrophosphatase or phosphodiesterase [Shimia isoporae]|uniref:Putative AlkP superfamily pyrophosphatase or phosphodiesterase n=1 Tax=Shimia isoporae TaxID=647720 RepID=A0A4R1N7J0_9RHOB|nr:alkaline phosphatase family protein [Shimia isoporae]TCL00757.1 putative AlkP superfamily pyrophosphatase or phosphodiesterase [Shimia isoporae]
MVTTKPFLALMGCALTLAPLPLQAQDAPRLVLQITVDQLRGDLIERFGAELGDGGFNRLRKSGVTYVNAHHRHANNETIVGHTTLSTGADPAIHGMVANLWYDRQSGGQFYNVQDADYPLVGAAGIDTENEIDPTQRAATTDGRSPRNIEVSTISDEIKMFYGDRSKVFGVSIKDRGAIAMAGHSGQAYWFSKSEGRFVTSTFYREDYPEWVEDWNGSGKVGAYANTWWTLRDERDTYLFGDRDDQPWETDFPGYGRVFPHDFGPADSKYYTTILTLSPAGDALTADFAKTLMDAEAVGRDEVTDYMSVSFSSTDYVGHIFGPSSLEAEDNIRRLDDTLADFLDHVDATVGLDKTLVVLSADHGAPDHPLYLAEFGIESDTFEFDRTDMLPGSVRLQAKLGGARDLVRNYSNPYMYLDRIAIETRGLDVAAVADDLSKELTRLEGIARAIPSWRLRNDKLDSDYISQAIRANFHPERSGDIYIVFDPHWFIADFDGLTVASAHGSPWSYDTHVPIIIAGPGIEPARVTRRVETVDVAATIATYLGTKLPSGAHGEPLAEVTR